jgi:asparagine synthase (glutamine-hydrolysing)
MSGILGIHFLDGRCVDRQDLAKMLDTLAHRGPDGADLWVDSTIGLGHRMLWTTPESLLEKLPLVYRAGDLVITADARIDNRHELALVLDLPDRPIEKITDSEFILAAYEKWEESCPEHLLGDFAFAIWNRQKQTLFCARDHMGVKPFYYHQGNKSFVFASEIKALLCLPEVSRQLSETKVGDYLASIFNDKSITFYQDIFRLPPASCLVLNAAGGMQIRTYWSLDPSHELQLDSDEAYAEALCDVFAEAVHCRLRSSFPVGSHLSGGIDSSSITCMARKLLKEEGNQRLLHTFSNIFDAVPECDERQFIESITAQGDIIPHYIHADQKGPLSDLEKVFYYSDEVVPAPTHFLIWGLNEATQKAGVRVVLDGFDGDNTLSHGSGYLSELLKQGKWETFATEVNALYKNGSASPRVLLQHYAFTYLENLASSGKWIAFVQAVNQILKYFNVSRRSIFLQQGLKPLLPSVVLQVWRSLRGRRVQSTNPSINNGEDIINHKFAQKLSLKERIQASRKSQPHPLISEREYHWRGLTAGIITLALEISDHYSAAFSIETRHPFMDKRLIEFCLSLPSNQKLNQGWTRFIMRRAMKNILPEQVQWRSDKSDMTASFTHGLLKHDRELLNNVMQNRLDVIAEYVDTEALQKIYKQWEATSTDQTSRSKSEGAIDLLLWQVCMLILWLDSVQLNHTI